MHLTLTAQAGLTFAGKGFEHCKLRQERIENQNRQYNKSSKGELTTYLKLLQSRLIIKLKNKLL